MFDVSFSELTVIAVVALIVVGPEKLPKVARTAGTIIGRFQRYAAQIREEVNREARFEDLQKLQQEIKAGVAQGASALREQVDHVIAPDNPSIAAPSKSRAKPKTLAAKQASITKKASVSKKSPADLPVPKPAKIATATKKSAGTKNTADKLSPAKPAAKPVRKPKSTKTQSA